MIAKALVLIVGLADVLSGAALLLARRWFFDNIGNFPPYSPHFLGDAGAFLLPVGIGLVIAARDPARFRSVVLIGTGASVLHFLNHLYGSVTAGESWIESVLLLIQAVAMVYVSVAVRGVTLKKTK